MRILHSSTRVHAVNDSDLWLLLEQTSRRAHQMITDVFASSFPHFYRSRVFSRSLTRAIFHTVLAISLLEVVRVGAFYEANRAAFARLDLHRIASELDNFPTDIELTFRKTRAAYSTKVSLAVSRELPFRLELSRSIHTGFSLMMAYMLRFGGVYLDVDGAQELLPTPEVLFLTERQWAKLDDDASPWVTLAVTEDTLYLFGQPYMSLTLAHTLASSACTRDRGGVARCSAADAARLGAALRRAAHLYGGGSRLTEVTYDVGTHPATQVLAHALLLCLYTVGCLVGTAEALLSSLIVLPCVLLLRLLGLRARHYYEDAPAPPHGSWTKLLLVATMYAATPLLAAQTILTLIANDAEEVLPAHYYYAIHVGLAAAATRLADGALAQLRAAEERLAASEAQLREAEARMEDLQRALPAQAVVDARQRATEAAAAAAEAVAVAAATAAAGAEGAAEAEEAAEAAAAAAEGRQRRRRRWRRGRGWLTRLRQQRRSSGPQRRRWQARECQRSRRGGCRFASLSKLTERQLASLAPNASARARRRRRRRSGGPHRRRWRQTRGSWQRRGARRRRPDGRTSSRRRGQRRVRQN